MQELSRSDHFENTVNSDLKVTKMTLRRVTENTIRKRNALPEVKCMENDSL